MANPTRSKIDQQPTTNLESLSDPPMSTKFVARPWVPSTSRQLWIAQAILRV